MDIHSGLAGKAVPSDEDSPQKIAPGEPDYWAVVQSVADLLTRFALPIYAEDDSGVPEQVGTGFLLHVQGRHFLVSAAHVLERHRSHPLFYYLSAKVIRTLDGHMLMDSAKDVGVVALSKQNCVPHPSTEKVAVRLDHLGPNLRPRADYSYAVTGFPSSRNPTRRSKLEIHASAYAWIGEGQPNEGHARPEAADEDMLFIKFDRKKAFRDEDTRITFPMPNGMSGGPMWALFENVDSNPLDRLRLAAVATTHLNPEKQMMGTDIAVPLRMIGGFLANVRADRNRLRRVPRAPFGLNYVLQTLAQS